MFRLMPKQAKLFEQLEQLAEVALEAAQVLGQLLGDLDHPAGPLARVEALERRGDEINHEALRMLQKGVSAPLDRNEVLDLLNELDDILDGTDAAVHRLVSYRVRRIKPEAIGMGKLLEQACVSVARAVGGLRTAKGAEGVLAHVVEVNRLENEGDELMRAAIGALFESEKDAIELIKWKELFEILEQALDSCEHVANAVERVVVQHA